MKKKVVILIMVLSIVLLFGYLYYSKIYMSDKNLLNRYLDSMGYTCIEDMCTLRKKNVKYSMNIKEQELYISTDEYNLSIGKEYPILKLKNGNKKCIYQIDDYKRGDLVTEEFSYDKDCKNYIDAVNDYIKEYMRIIVESNVKYMSDLVK